MTDITLVSPKISGFSGTSSYVSNVLKGFDKAKITYDLRYVKKREVSLFGKPYFGILFQSLLSKLVFSSTPIVHALAPEVITRHTNVLTIHDIIPYTKPEIYMKTFYDKIAYNLLFEKATRVDNILVSTNVGKTELQGHLDIPGDRIKVIYHSIDHDKFFFDSRNPFEEGSVNIVMMSDYNPRKRIDIIVRSLRGDSELSFFHIGPKQKWENNYHTIQDLSNGYSNIHLLGPLSSDDARRYISNADLFVYLSEEEGFGYPVLEALACGTNILVSDIPVFRELFQDVGHFVRLNDFTADTVRGAIANRKPRNELIQFSQKYSIDRMCKEIFGVYNSLLARS